MNKGFIFTLGLILGAAAGAFGAWSYTKGKYQQIADEEIASVKEHFSVPRTVVNNYGVPKKPTDIDSDSDNSKKADKAKNKPDIKEYTSKLSKCDYTRFSNSPVTPVKTTAPEPSEEATNERPYILEPSEFADRDEYESITLFHFEDDVLTDDDFVPVEDPSAIVPSDYFQHFGEFESDAVYVRNDQLKCDYEILREYRRFEDLGKNVRRAADEAPSDQDDD